MPKIVDYAQRRKEIAQKAVPVFAEAGFHDANLSRIAGLCGFGRTTIYKYFKDKDEIFAYVLAEIFERLEAGAEAVVSDRERDSTGKLAALFDGMIRDSIDDRSRMLIVLDLVLRLRREESSFAAGTRERLVGLKSYYEQVLAEGMASGELRRGDPKALASVLFSIVEASVLQHSLFDDFSYVQAMEAARLLLEGLRAGPR